MIMTPKQRFFITGDLLYPAVLGAGIAWWAEALVHWKAHGNAPATVGWSLLFGAFFIVYHGRSFVILREEETWRDKSGKEMLVRGGTGSTPGYSVREFVKDLINCAALLLAFVCLRLPDSKLDLVDPVGAFVVAALIPLGALITEATVAPRILNNSWPLRGVSLVVALYGAWDHWTLARDSVVPSDVDRRVLGALIVLPVAYLGCPRIFGVRTPEQRSQGVTNLFSEVQENVRTIVAVIALVGVLILVWTRIRAEPAETSALAEGWVLVGIVQNFDSGKPCGATPALKDQIPAVIAALQAMRPSKVRVIGVADTTPLTPLVRDFVGNNAGLAHMRAECVTRWLDTSKELAGVEFSEGVEPPREFRSADSMDRAVVVWASTRSLDLRRHP